MVLLFVVCGWQEEAVAGVFLRTYLVHSTYVFLVTRATKVGKIVNPAVLPTTLPNRVFYYCVEPYKHNNYMAMIIICKYNYEPTSISHLTSKPSHDASRHPARWWRWEDARALYHAQEAWPCCCLEAMMVEGKTWCAAASELRVTPPPPKN